LPVAYSAGLHTSVHSPSTNTAAARPIVPFGSRQGYGVSPGSGLRRGPMTPSHCEICRRRARTACARRERRSSGTRKGRSAPAAAEV
jgi:hypothetical protein